MTELRLDGLWVGAPGDQKCRTGEVVDAQYIDEYVAGRWHDGDKKIQPAHRAEGGPPEGPARTAGRLSRPSRE